MSRRGGRTGTILAAVAVASLIPGCGLLPFSWDAREDPASLEAGSERGGPPGRPDAALESHLLRDLPQAARAAREGAGALDPVTEPLLDAAVLVALAALIATAWSLFRRRRSTFAALVSGAALIIAILAFVNAAT